MAVADEGLWFEAGLRVESLILDSSLTFDCGTTTNDLCSAGLSDNHVGSIVGGSAAFFYSDSVWGLGARVALGQGSFEPESTVQGTAADPLDLFLVAFEIPIEAHTGFEEFELFVQVTLRYSNLVLADDSNVSTSNVFGGLLTGGLRFYGFGLAGSSVAGEFITGTSGEVTYRIRLDDEPPARPKPTRPRPAPAPKPPVESSPTQAPAQPPTRIDEPADDPKPVVDEPDQPPSTPSTPSAP